MGRAARHFAAAALERRPQQRVSRARTWMMPLNVEATSVKLEMPPPTMSARPRPSAPAVATSSIVLAYAYVSCAATTPSVAPPAICDPAAVWRHADVAEPLRRRRLPVRESDSFQAHVAPSSQAPHECLLGRRRTAVRQRKNPPPWEHEGVPRNEPVEALPTQLWQAGMHASCKVPGAAAPPPGCAPACWARRCTPRSCPARPQSPGRRPCRRRSRSRRRRPPWSTRGPWG